MWFERNEHGRLEELRNGDEPTDAVEMFPADDSGRTSPSVILAARAVIAERVPAGINRRLPDNSTTRELLENLAHALEQSSGEKREVPDYGKAVELLERIAALEPKPGVMSRHTLARCRQLARAALRCLSSEQKGADQ